MSDRQMMAHDVRRRTAGIADGRAHEPSHNNGDEARLRDPATNAATYAGNFTKCLPHDDDGFVDDPGDYADFVRAIDSAQEADFAALRIGPGPYDRTGQPRRTFSGALRVRWKHPGYATKPTIRGWESPGAGSAFSIEGPDPQQPSMPPAPSFDSAEVTSEMGELYCQALCRDVAFADWEDSGSIDAARAALSTFAWFREDGTDELGGRSDQLVTSLARRRVLTPDAATPVELTSLFRGDAPGERVGPYLSQFLVVGNTGVHRGDAAAPMTDGMISFGAQRIDQRVRVATPGKDYMTSWAEFLDVQNGAALGGTETYVGGEYRPITTPRDMCTYVHHDALYQAYLNACLWMLGAGVPFDPGLPFQRDDHIDKQSGFATFGGPHVLTLLTEVATRALKTVRYQKFNVHRRLRPEAMGGWMHRRRNGSAEVAAKLADLEQMEVAIGASGIGDALDDRQGVGNWLLPMAFAEGSPAHPSYGAGHATVAGACVTILKAWFDSGWLLKDATGADIAYVPHADGVSAPVDVSGALDGPLTLEGELNKLAANISIARNWAGVHWYSDDHESLRLGEQVALGILEEQKVLFNENFSMTVPLLDGSTVRI
ncbi:vanadium-dependent haloperoxidase [Ilumatobacter sp.]|uniref:vanadium-dependent haloperoxidase n=1 Tax=Ilumatobacter sp. TaxID=1967498 RepID=UPI003B530017